MGDGSNSMANKAVGAVIAAVVVIAIVALALMRFGAAGPAPLRAIVHDSDGGVRELPLSEDSRTTVTTALGTNVVVVENGAVSVREADCDNHDCIRQGSVDAPGKQIICLPHKLWIEVVAEGEGAGQMDVDAAAGEDGLDVVTR